MKLFMFFNYWSKKQNSLLNNQYYTNMVDTTGWKVDCDPLTLTGNENGTKAEVIWKAI